MQPNFRGTTGLHQLRPGILDDAVKRAVSLLADHHLEERWAEENFTELRAFCGMDVVAAEYIRLYADLRETARPSRAG